MIADKRIDPSVERRQTVSTIVPADLTGELYAGVLYDAQTATDELSHDLGVLDGTTTTAPKADVARLDELAELVRIEATLRSAKADVAFDDQLSERVVEIAGHRKGYLSYTLGCLGEGSASTADYRPCCDRIDALDAFVAGRRAPRGGDFVSAAEWDARAALAVGASIRRHLLIDPPPQGARYAGDLERWAENLPVGGAA